MVRLAGVLVRIIGSRFLTSGIFTPVPRALELSGYPLFLNLSSSEFESESGILLRADLLKRPPNATEELGGGSFDFNKKGTSSNALDSGFLLGGRGTSLGQSGE